MKVYLVIHQDRHTDVAVIPHLDQGSAIDAAHGIAACYQDAEEKKIEGWLLYFKLSESGEYVRVQEAEVVYGPHEPIDPMTEKVA